MKELTLTAKVPKMSDRAKEALLQFGKNEELEAMKKGQMTTKITVPEDTDLPEDWDIGLLHGPSGTGKTSILKSMFDYKIGRLGKSKVALDLVPDDQFLWAAGFNDLRAALRPYGVLSFGQKHRVNIARQLYLASRYSNTYVIDEFCSVLDATSAYAVCSGINKLMKNVQMKGRIVFATPRNDIYGWLGYNWLYDTGIYKLRSSKEGTKRNVELLFEEDEEG